MKYSFDPYDNRVPKPVSVTVDGDFIITAKPIELWDIDTGQKVKGLSGYSGSILKQFLQDAAGRYMAAHVRDSVVV